jgi:hypothetical protein
MRILDDSAYLRGQGLALAQLIAIHRASADMRWALLAAISRSFVAAARTAARRIARRAHFISPADTMVAAGGALGFHRSTKSGAFT